MLFAVSAVLAVFGKEIDFTEPLAGTIAAISLVKKFNNAASMSGIHNKKGQYAVIPAPCNAWVFANVVWSLWLTQEDEAFGLIVI